MSAAFIGKWFGLRYYFNVWVTGGWFEIWRFGSDRMLIGVANFRFHEILRYSTRFLVLRFFCCFLRPGLLRVRSGINSVFFCSKGEDGFVLRAHGARNVSNVSLRE